MVTRARDTDAEMFERFSRRSNMEFAYNAFRMVNGHAPEVEAHDTRYWDFVRNSPAATAVRSVGAAFNSVTWVIQTRGTTHTQTARAVPTADVQVWKRSVTSMGMTTPTSWRRANEV